MNTPEHVAAAGSVGEAVQRTLAGEVSLSGVGLFSGKRVNVTLSPAEAGSGVRFERVDLRGGEALPVSVEHAVALRRRTALKRGDVSVELTEHLLAALAGCGVDNCVVSLDAGEPPIGDGGASHFVRAIERVGLVEQGVRREPMVVRQPLTLREGGSSIVALPWSEGLELTYVLDYGEGSDIPSGTATVRVTPATFGRELAPARTFSSRSDAEAARAAGMFEHMSVSDVLVFERGRAIENELRFENEAARHKALDLLGDLALLGRPILGRFVAHRSGHGLNVEMARALAAQERSHRAAGEDGAGRGGGERAAVGSASGGSGMVSGAGVGGGRSLSINKIMTLMPHRYPMLLVDRVVELEANRRAVGLKNVTINEPMFQGHYPHNPIMPGVLVVEAMAQLAGLMMHESLEHEEKIALLLSLERVKLRKPVIPGDQLRMETEVVRSNRRSAEVHCRSFVEAELAAEARVKFLMVDRAFDRG